jgi:hypothetical protein
VIFQGDPKNSFDIFVVVDRIAQCSFPQFPNAIHKIVVSSEVHQVAALEQNNSDPDFLLLVSDQVIDDLEPIASSTLSRPAQRSHSVISTDEFLHNNLQDISAEDQ